MIDYNCSQIYLWFSLFQPSPIQHASLTGPFFPVRNCIGQSFVLHRYSTGCMAIISFSPTTECQYVVIGRHPSEWNPGSRPRSLGLVKIKESYCNWSTILYCKIIFCPVVVRTVTTLLPITKPWQNWNGKGFEHNTLDFGRRCPYEMLRWQ